MIKPATQRGYSEQQTLSCERVLVTLLRGMGPWKESVYLIGGLVPRYLITARPPQVPAHAGTQDIDVVIDVQILADTEAYHSLEENLKKMSFERAENEAGKRLSWRWQTRTEHGVQIILELLTDAPTIAGGRVQPLPTNGTISALNIPHSSMVFDMHEVTEVQAELLGGNGIATERIKYANLVCFVCLKLFAYEQRFERKDAHDLFYCLDYVQGDVSSVAHRFNTALNCKHQQVIRESLSILQRRFGSDKDIEGYRKDGPVSVSKFELGEDLYDAELRNQRLLRQRYISEQIDQLLTQIDYSRLAATG